ncbi:hypothetical protein BIV57_05570 [Mangrovactinospora gilvigrisea]|uniref:Major facilitator superfamily (MFS) profile domain-containing protein n=1 Tax=Mangrovactinospora gilvigrisea TaxID=1428644 RepID=A0A1J7CAD2_9ACTN|nr:MFS transporter [Mangrovactinospora gilvigrisea]OIV38472.1 hypothetical protein BIV57_05570 [Mangrovactinospora gilvigrisea]
MLLVAVSAMFMAQFDLFVVNIAVPSLRGDLGAGPGALELVVGGYAFAFAAGLITGGRLGDRFGYRRVFIAGMAAFSVASLLCGLAVDPAQLVAARLLQGLSAAAMVPQVLSLITVGFPPEERGRAIGWYGFSSGVGALAGQILGALLLQANVLGLGWRTVFLVNVPVGAVVIVFARRELPRGEPRAARLDPVGAVGVTAALAAVLAPISLGPDAGWPLWTWLVLAAAVPLGAAALAWQRRLRARGGSPLLDLALFGNRRYARMLAAGVAFQLYFGSFMFTLTLLLQQGFGRSPFQAALIFLPQAVLFSASSLAGSRIVARYGPGVTRVACGGLLAGVLVLGVLASAVDSALWLVLPLSLIGLCNGLVLPPLMGAALREVRAEQAGAASGLMTTSQQFANAAGVAALGAVYFAGAHAVVTAVHAGLAAVVLLLL